MNWNLILIINDFVFEFTKCVYLSFGRLAGRSLGKLNAVVMDPYVECYPTAYKVGFLIINCYKFLFFCRV